MKSIFLTSCFMIISMCSYCQFLSNHDGDTFTYFIDTLGSYKNIRIANIDAPELNQPFGIESKNYLDTLLRNSDIQLKFINVDKYNRLVCDVFINGDRLDSILVYNGFAYVYNRYNHYENLNYIQDLARLERKNIWSLFPIVYPWDFRKIKKLPKFKFINFSHF